MRRRLLTWKAIVQNSTADLPRTMKHSDDAAHAGKTDSPLTSADAQPLKRRSSVVMVSPSAFVLIWWGILGFHIFTATFTLFAAFVHLVLSIEVFHRATSALLIPIPLKRLAGLSYLVVAVLHLLAVSRMISVSLRARSLTLSRTVVAEPVTAESSFKIMRVYYRLARLQAAVFGPDGYVGINGPMFSASLLVREILEVMLQSYQLWSLSHNISRAWINNLAVMAVVVNCFSIQIVNQFFQKRESTRRIMHFVVDMQLDFICTVLVPVCVIVPYPLQFDWEANVYPMKLMLDNVWFANAVSEARQMLVTSYTDYFSSLFPHYSIYNSLRILKRLIHRKKTSRGRRAVINPLFTLPPPVTLIKSTTSESITVGPKSESRFTRLGSTGIAIWGVVLLGLHLHALLFGQGFQYEGCELHVKPWLVTKVACSVMVANCYRWNVSGSASEMTQILDPLEETVVTKLIFAHCPRLVVPSLLTRFSQLGTLETFNSTLVDWPVEAAIRQKTHPTLSDMYITITNLTAIPPALLHSELPQSLGKIAFYNCNLTSLPDDIGGLWSTSQLTRISFEYTALKKIPVSFGRMRLQKLWLVASPTEQIPDDIFADRTFTTIRLSGLPLQRLPDTIGDTSKLKELLVEYTNVSNLPPWATLWLEAHASVNDTRVRSFYGSPVCDPSRSNLTTAVIAAWRICERDYLSQFGEHPRQLYEGLYPV